MTSHSFLNVGIHTAIDINAAHRLQLFDGLFDSPLIIAATQAGKIIGGPLYGVTFLSVEEFVTILPQSRLQRFQHAIRFHLLLTELPCCHIFAGMVQGIAQHGFDFPVC